MASVTDANEENDQDSGMDSPQAPEEEPTSKDEYTPEKKQIEEDYDDEPDETMSERLWGLTEMFPEPVRNATCTVMSGTKSGLKSIVNLTKNSAWILFTTSFILFGPVIIETERANMDEMQRSQQRQVLLGPNTATSGPPLMPPMQR